MANASARRTSDNSKVIGMIVGAGWAFVGVLFGVFAAGRSGTGALPVLAAAAGVVTAVAAAVLLYLDRRRPSLWCFLVSGVAVVVAGGAIMRSA